MAGMSKTVVNRIKNSAVVVSSGEVHGPEVGERLEAKFSAAGAVDVDAVMIDKVISGLMTMVKTATAKLESAEQTYAAELSNDGDKRGERDNAVQDLRARLTDSRQLLRTFGTDSVLVNYGLVDVPPTTPDRLEKYALFVAKQLRQNPRTFTYMGITVDTVAMADELEPAVEQLVASLASLSVDARLNQLAKEARDSVLNAWNLDYSACASILSDLFRLAERPALAARVRPTRRRVSGEVSPEDEQADEGADENSGGQAGENSGAQGKEVSNEEDVTEA